MRTFPIISRSQLREKGGGVGRFGRPNTPPATHYCGVLIIIVTLVLIAAGCRQPTADEQVEGNLQGTVTISGAWALYPLVVRWGEEFQELHPAVRFDISAGGAGKGMADALADAVDIGMVSREVYPEEVEKGAFWVSVAKDAVFPTVNRENPVWEDLLEQGIPQETFFAIYIAGKVTNWGQVVGRHEVTDPIHVFTRSDACGAAATWARYLGMAQEDLLGVAVYGDPGLLEAVIKDPLGVGYNNLNFAFDMETGNPVSGALVVPVDLDEDGKADADEIWDTKDQAIEAVATGRYPSPPARDLNLVTQGKPVGLERAFITWVLTEGQDYVSEVGYVALREGRLDTELKKID